MAKARRNNAPIVVVLVSVVGGMLALTASAVPLYRLFCSVTGFGGTTGVTTAETAKAASDKTIAVRFDANVNPALPWRFEPEKREVRVRLGEPTLAFYKAVNVSDHTVTGTATYNVTPYKAGIYFSKIQCFCFTEQTLAPHQSAEMTVQFVVDPEIFKDPNTTDVTAITLSYTFFPKEAGETTDKTSRLDAPAASPTKG